MREIPPEEVRERIRFENPWWKSGEINEEVGAVRPRAYLTHFLQLAQTNSPHRALLLMGPRRVGKTWMMYHTIQRLIDGGRDPRCLCYINVQNPLYNGLGLEDLMKIGLSSAEVTLEDRPVVFFDEIQYLREWEVHLKTLVDSYRSVKFVASGSAAAALKLKSDESGAGRFTDFLLPPLTFYEYLEMLGKDDLVTVNNPGDRFSRSFGAVDIHALNESFLHYLNFGGYPEVVFSSDIQADPGRFVKADIVDKVLMKDLPSLYGIQDVQELNSLFQTLTYNTAGEISLGELSQKSGVAKNTIKRYIEYLESAFLIRVVHRVDHNAKRFQRATRFKVYLTNPSLFCALFSPVATDDNAIGNLVETGVFAQWFHNLNFNLHYARWKKGEVDIVSLERDLRPSWAVEVKWSDRYAHNPHQLTGLIEFCKRHPSCFVCVTTRTIAKTTRLESTNVLFEPASLYCFALGYNLIHGRATSFESKSSQETPDRDK